MERLPPSQERPLRLYHPFPAAQKHLHPPYALCIIRFGRIPQGELLTVGWCGGFLRFLWLRSFGRFVLVGAFMLLFLFSFLLWSCIH